MGEVYVPIEKEGKKWLLLNHLSNSGTLRAVHISKVRQVHESDSHHCSEISAKSSVRYHPKKWVIL